MPAQGCDIGSGVGWCSCPANEVLAERTALCAMLQRSGVSSRVLGVNMGHRALGTNAWHFMRRLGVNGARVFLYSAIPCAAAPSHVLTCLRPGPASSWTTKCTVEWLWRFMMR